MPNLGFGVFPDLLVSIRFCLAKYIKDIEVFNQFICFRLWFVQESKKWHRIVYSSLVQFLGLVTFMKFWLALDRLNPNWNPISHYVNLCFSMELKTRRGSSADQKEEIRHCLASLSHHNSVILTHAKLSSVRHSFMWFNNAKAIALIDACSIKLSLQHTLCSLLGFGI